MPTSAPRALLLTIALPVLAGCAVASSTVGTDPQPDIDQTLELMARARLADGEQWLRLHNVLASAAVMNPKPQLRARVALALSVGNRSPDELARAETLMDALLAEPATSDELAQATRNLLLVQRDLLRARRESAARIDMLDKSASQRDAALSRERSAHAKTRARLDETRNALASARKKLRQVTRIELKHEASGS